MGDEILFSLERLGSVNVTNLRRTSTNTRSYQIEPDSWSLRHSLPCHLGRSLTVVMPFISLVELQAGRSDA
jgi:hypothetical protein